MNSCVASRPHAYRATDTTTPKKTTTTKPPQIFFFCFDHSTIVGSRHCFEHEDKNASPRIVPNLASPLAGPIRIAMVSLTRLCLFVWRRLLLQTFWRHYASLAVELVFVAATFMYMLYHDRVDKAQVKKLNRSYIDLADLKSDER
ncbi:hypothetical protein MRX96_039659 [Rhipicephalus microplus]